ncbi:hypothetical protein OKW21_006729 [Catalinimonas alkaloidigena]|uniref:hypothetical protein n=1 Tax=Catalinimonas alkaloidigena TaxID=1075417 RepID=UPI002406B5B5|nr:hypothetical protein [Catalinimonas alkaloidigena]MDF9801420.1 hypothetical protein [Catalinimonas alkaloidigena]
MNWIYKPDTGIQLDENEKIRIRFGDSREELRSRLNYQKPRITRFENEDSYENILGSGDWIRLSFQENQLDEIEILIGKITIGKISIAVDEDLDLSLAKFRDEGFGIKEGDMSYVIPELKLDIGDSGKNGGEDNKICWLFMTRDVEYLMNE